MINKKLLIQRAARTTRLLLDEGFDRVVILWDENPPWMPEKDFADQRCWHAERDQLLKSLSAAKIGEKVRRQRVKLVCIEREFETWLLHDDQLVRDVVSTAHRARVQGLADPLRIDDPKAKMKSFFQRHGTRYNPDVAAKKFANCLGNLNRLRRCDTFRYFVQCVLGTMPNGWQPYAYQPKGPKK